MASAIILLAAVVAAQDAEPPTPAPAAPPPATTRPAADSDELEPPREPTATDILRELTRPDDAPPRPVILPSQPGQTVRRKEVDPSAIPPNAVAPVTPKLYPDGYRIVDRPGRLAREGDYYVFAFESRGRGEPELPIRLLPNRLLEDMEIVTAGGTRPVVFLISGELTEYHGVNYLLVQKLLTRPELGNLK
ncbi:MAG: hypothetical protein DCC65_01105 [Planctomycetota bacterium]|nr:MAG: hypothetical protein DCC65_01105 [Planctomycetota bacterium]